MGWNEAVFCQERRLKVWSTKIAFTIMPYLNTSSNGYMLFFLVSNDLSGVSFLLSFLHHMVNSVQVQLLEFFHFPSAENPKVFLLDSGFLSFEPLFSRRDEATLELLRRDDFPSFSLPATHNKRSKTWHPPHCLPCPARLFSWWEMPKKPSSSQHIPWNIINFSSFLLPSCLLLLHSAIIQFVSKSFPSCSCQKECVD